MTTRIRGLSRLTLPETPVVCHECVWWQSKTGRRANKDRWTERVEDDFGPWGALYCEDDGRVIDYNASRISTSEGQAYAMLRAVWIGDRSSFTSPARHGDELHGRLDQALAVDGVAQLLTESGNRVHDGVIVIHRAGPCHQ